MKKLICKIAVLALMVATIGSLTSAEDVVLSSGFQGICKQGISNGFYYMYRDAADGGKVKEFPAFNIKSTSENLTVNMAWTISKTQAFPFMTDYSTHPEVGLAPILQWRATADGTAIFKVVEMGATFDEKIGEIRKTAIFMNPGAENSDGVTVTLYKNDLKSKPIKTGLITDKSDFTFNETIAVKKGDSISLEYDSNTSKSGDSLRGLFELTFIEAATSVSSTVKSSTAISASNSASTASNSVEVSSTPDSSTTESVASGNDSSIASSKTDSNVSSNASDTTSEDKTGEKGGLPVWATVLIIVVVLAGGGAITYLVIKNKK